jgi:hypothetical protein
MMYLLCMLRPVPLDCPASNKRRGEDLRPSAPHRQWEIQDRESVPIFQKRTTNQKRSMEQVCMLIAPPSKTGDDHPLL